MIPAAGAYLQRPTGSWVPGFRGSEVQLGLAIAPRPIGFFEVSVYKALKVESRACIQRQVGPGDGAARNRVFRSATWRRRPRGAARDRGSKGKSGWREQQGSSAKPALHAGSRGRRRSDPPGPRSIVFRQEQVVLIGELQFRGKPAHGVIMAAAGSSPAREARPPRGDFAGFELDPRLGKVAIGRHSWLY